MTTDHKPRGTIALAVLVTIVMLSAAFTAMATAAAGTTVNAQARTAAACGQAPVALGAASTYAALSGTGVTSTGATALTGDLGVSPGTSVTGFPPATLTGTKNVANVSAASATSALTTAYNDAAGRTLCPVSVAGNLGGQTLTPGLYKSTSTLAISSGDLTLSGGGNPNGVFIFQVASALTTTSGSSVILTNGAQAGNVFWQIGSSASLGTTSVMEGTLLAYASVTMATGAHLDGRALARTGDVTLAASTIVVPTTNTVTTYTVEFSETGLPTGTSWSVTLNGVQASATNSTIDFVLASGTYSYTVGSISGYGVSPSTGSVTVNGAAVSQSIAYTANAPGTYSVIFTESGLAAGTSWSVTLNGAQKTSATTTIGFAMPNGTSAYTVAASSGFTVSPSSGSVTVHGATNNQAITFTASGTGGGGGSNGTSPGGPSWMWPVIVAIGAIAALGAGIALFRRRGGKKVA